jgi:nucleotide-binding universal stress UspA family protein
MITIRKILVPTDFSANAALAYPYASTLAATFGASIVLVHVTEPLIYPVGPGQIPVGWESLESERAEHVADELARLRSAFGDVPVSAIRRDGSPALEVVRCARDEAVDLIVVATHGHTGIKHLLMGSNAEKIVRKAPCPVLTVRPEGRDFVLP